MAGSLDAFFEETALTKDIKVRRSFGAKYFAHQLGVPMDALDTMTDKELRERFVGATYMETAYGSTTMIEHSNVSFSAAESERSMSFNIRARKGSKAALVAHVSSHPGESEILFPRGTSYVVRRIRRKSDKGWVADVDVIGCFPPSLY